jgi:NADH dehydrogenase (ubiquinone) Fe-S protein 4
VYSPARTASQQGRALVGNWKIEFESAKKWDNPLMGWASSGDMASTTGQMALNFTSKDAALAFANKHGWEVELTEPKKMVTGRRAKAYADRFSFKRKGLPIDPRGQ